MKHGSMTEEEAKEDTARATRQYARRQETWFINRNIGIAG
jgi:tRNA dimethylallyltransferase